MTHARWRGSYFRPCGVAALAVAVLLTGTTIEGGERGLNITITPDPIGSAHGFQVSPEPWCPGEQLPFTLQMTGDAGVRIVGSAVAVSNLEFFPPCTVTAGTGTCTVQDASTITWDIVSDGAGVMSFSVQTAIPANAPSVGQICMAITYTVTPAGGAPGEPVTLTPCFDYSCPRIPALGPAGRAFLVLALALAAAFALARRVA